MGGTIPLIYCHTPAHERITRSQSSDDGLLKTDYFFVMLRVLATLALLCLSTAQLHAACTSPAGETGHMIFNTTQKVAQYCNGTAWVNMGAPSPTAVNGSCSTPAGRRGQVIYNSTQKVHQFCNGATWVDMACGVSSASGTSCSSPAGQLGHVASVTSGTVTGMFGCTAAGWLQLGRGCAFKGLTCGAFSSSFTTCSGSMITYLGNIPDYSLCQAACESTPGTTCCYVNQGTDDCYAYTGSVAGSILGSDAAATCN